MLILSYFGSFRETTPRKREEYAYILDVFEAESSLTHRKLTGRIAQLLGGRYFILLEGLLKENVAVERLERVYVGSGSRDKIASILKRIGLEDLTQLARVELRNTIEKSMLANEDKWVEFFNKMGPMTKRLHSLELLPGIGNKTMWEIIQKRERAPFTSFRDIYERVGIDPSKAIIKRILVELEGNEKYYLFVDVSSTRERI